MCVSVSVCVCVCMLPFQILICWSMDQFGASSNSPGLFSGRQTQSEELPGFSDSVNLVSVESRDNGTPRVHDIFFPASLGLAIQKYY